VVFALAAYDEIVATTLRIIEEEGSVTVARFRDHFGSSRKYALAVLEHFDRLHLTRRVGDERVRGTARNAEVGTRNAE
jgi:selenocysteine-specific elongation factor